MTIGPAGTVNTNVPPQNYGGVSQEQVEDFKEAVSHSTTSSNASGMQSSQSASEYSQDTSKSLPFVLATRPPINLGSPTVKQGAPLYDTQGTSGSGGTSGTSGTGHTTGTKQVEHTPKGGGETVKLKDFKPPGWEDAGGNPEACYKLACAGASQTSPAGQSVTGGGGVILYDDRTGLGSEIIKNPAQRIHTDKVASDVALEQIKRHIDDARAVVAGVSEPASDEIVDGPKIEMEKKNQARNR
jgi:hypothetical protein